MSAWFLRVDRVWDTMTTVDIDGAIESPDGGDAVLPRAGQWFRLVPVSTEEVRDEMATKVTGPKYKAADALGLEDTP